MIPPTEITLRRPDDWHCHLRDGAMMASVAPFTARRFARAIIMPNLLPVQATTISARQYRGRILDALPEGTQFTPLMTCYLTDRTDPDDVARGFEEGVFTAVKFYPADATTNSADGVTDIRKVYPVLERMQKIGMPLLVHGEVVGDVDIFDREAVFIERVFTPLLGDFPGLKTVFEHITTSEAVDFVRASGGRVGATITAHHLMINRNAMFEGGIRPHRYCLPVAKREAHRRAVRAAAVSGEPCFFLGTDSAPHEITAKVSACGCAGIFTAPAALELYVQVFEEENALDRLEAFASLNGAAFYGLPVNEGALRLVRQEWTVPEKVEVAGTSGLHPFMAGRNLRWRLADG